MSKIHDNIRSPGDQLNTETKLTLTSFFWLRYCFALKVCSVVWKLHRTASYSHRNSSFSFFRLSVASVVVAAALVRRRVAVWADVFFQHKWTGVMFVACEGCRSLPAVAFGSLFAASLRLWDDLSKEEMIFKPEVWELQFILSADFKSSSSSSRCRKVFLDNSLKCQWC